MTAPSRQPASNGAIRVCHIVGSMDDAVGSSLLRYCHRIDPAKVRFDFVCAGSVAAPLQDEVASLGGHIFTVPKMADLRAFKRSCYQLLHDHTEWEIVECHLGAGNAYALGQARRACVTARIAHAHEDDRRLGSPRDKRLWQRATRLSLAHFASDEQTGRQLFGENQRFETVPDIADTTATDEVGKAADLLTQMYALLASWAAKYDAQ